MARAGIPTRFAFSPTPLDDELLSSWLHRMAIGHAASGLEFIQLAGGDLDWRPPNAVVVRLAAGSERSFRRLRAMTLSNRHPHAKRDQFALSQRPFPGCHSFCPLCAREDVITHGAVVQRAANAWVWSAACETHGCLLDGVGGPEDVTPRWSRTAPWDDGAIAPAPITTKAPEFLVEFQSTALDAWRGVAPDARWLVREPDAFQRAIRQITDLVLLMSSHDRYSSGLGQLVGHLWPETLGMGSPTWRTDWIGGLPTPERVRALAGVALLLVSPSGSLSASTNAWFGRNHPVRPWARIGGLWGVGQLAEALNLAAGWPNALREEAEQGLGLSLTELERRGYSLAR